jgi:hypothetical protein
MEIGFPRRSQGAICRAAGWPGHGCPGLESRRNSRRGSGAAVVRRGEGGADEGGPGVSGATAERKTWRGEKWAPTSGPGVAAGRVARGAEKRWLAGLVARARAELGREAARARPGWVLALGWCGRGEELGPGERERGVRLGRGRELGRCAPGGPRGELG